MYQKFYGLNSKPFHIIPDLAFLFMSSRHKVALDCMEFGLMNNAGIILITGDIGTGKTTMIQRLLQGLEVDIRPGCIYNTNLNPEQFLSLVLQEFGIEADAGSKSRNIHAMQQSLQQMRSAKQRPLLIVDDAQNLTFEVLEEVRWLSGIQDEKGMLLQIILVGQPELKARLEHPSMASLGQRIGASYNLTPFTPEEAQAYIVHRLHKAGRLTPLFTKPAIDAVYKVTGGIPRTINLLCDNALVYGFADGLQEINPPTIEQVVSELGSYGVGFGTPSRTREPAGGKETAPTHATAREDKEATLTSEDFLGLRKDIELILQRTKKLEERTDLLDRSVGIYANELQQILRDQLAEERLRNERLMLQLAQTKTGAGTDCQTAGGGSATPILLASQKKGRE